MATPSPFASVSERGEPHLRLRCREAGLQTVLPHSHWIVGHPIRYHPAMLDYVTSALATLLVVADPDLHERTVPRPDLRYERDAAP